MKISKQRVIANVPTMVIVENHKKYSINPKIGTCWSLKVVTSDVTTRKKLSKQNNQ